MKKNNLQRDPKQPSKKRAKVALGRGLDALIPDIEALTPARPDFFECATHLIQPNPYQPRQHFCDDELTHLCQSIREQGIIQPLLVRKTDDGYELIAGERRLRAAKLAGLKRVPVIVKKAADDKLLELSIVENIQRADLNPIEEAEAYHRLMSASGLTQEQAAERVGKSRSAVANILRLRQLPEEIKDSIRNGVLSEGHARALLGISAPVQLRTIWKTILAKNLSVRATERLVKHLKTRASGARKNSAAPDAHYFTDLSLELSRCLGTKVAIKRRGSKGKVEIAFYSNDDLDRVINLLKKLI